MRRALKALFGVSLSFLAVAACGLDDSGVIDGFGPEMDGSVDGESDATIDAAGDANGADSSATDGSFHDGASDDGGPTDAAVDASDASTDGGSDASDAAVDAGPCPTLTLCDSDASVCNASQVCVPDIPAGWTLAGFDPPSASPPAPCGGSYAANSTTQITDGGSVTCACACNGGTTPSCSNVRVVLGTDTGCSASPITAPVTAACSDLAANYPVANSLLQAHLQADPTTCAPMLDASIPSDVVGAARTCDFTGDAGAFCASHATCVEASSATHKTCIKQAYSGVVPPACGASCPTGFQTSCFATAASTADGRTCTSCTCGWSNAGCSAATVTGSDMSGCSGGPTHNATIGLDTCAAFPLANVSALGVSGTDGTPTCDMTASATSSGSFVATGESIVCCAN